MKNQALSADEAENLLRSGKIQPGLHFPGKIKIPTGKVPVLPDNLSIETLDFSGNHSVTAIPANLHVRHLKLNGCENLKSIGSGLRARHVELRETPLEELPSAIQVEFKLDATNCSRLKTLPQLQTGSLVLRGCVALEALPEGLDVCFLDISGCVQIKQFPQTSHIRFGRLVARDCTNLEVLPNSLGELAALDLRNCPKIGNLPQNLKINGWIDIAGTAITKLPESLNRVGLRWRGVPVNEQVVFRPETLSADDIIKQRNAEVRRVMLERLGFERFLSLSNAKIIDTDCDKGGERRLFNVEMPGDENLRCVSFSCPSTKRQYIIRVPPTVMTCHAAVAWMAGFDDPNEYKPDIET